MPPTTASPAPTSDPDDRPRIASGTVFVLVSAVLAVAFVLFLVFVSPVLLERTVALAPPPAPQVIASGTLEGRTWSATAYDRAAGERGVTEDGHEPIVEEEPCLAVDLGENAAPSEVCVLRRGGSLRAVEAAADPSGRAVVYGIVAPEVATVELEAEAGEVLRATPAYVDFGFPLGFFAVEVDGGTAIHRLRALDRDGAERARGTCGGGEPLDACELVEGDY